MPEGNAAYNATDLSVVENTDLGGQPKRGKGLGWARSAVWESGMYVHARGRMGGEATVQRILAGVAILAFSLVSIPVTAAPQDNKRPVFMRVDTDAEGKPRALQTAIATYEIESGAFKGATVDLVGAVHIGEKSYYKELNKKFKDYDAVLYELVAESDDKPSKREEGGINPVGSVQNGMKDMLKLSFQLEEIDYDAKNFVHADMSPSEFGQDMIKRNDGFVNMFARMMGAGFAAQVSKKNSEIQAEMMSAMLSRNVTKLRRAMARQMEMMDNQLVGIADKEGKSTLLTERNAKAFEVLERELQSGDKKVSVFYGAGHLLDMHDRMLRDFGAKLTKIEWVDAWDLRSEDEKKQSDR